MGEPLHKFDLCLHSLSPSETVDPYRERFREANTEEPLGADDPR
jgi:hypothetical protein